MINRGSGYGPGEGFWSTQYPKGEQIGGKLRLQRNGGDLSGRWRCRLSVSSLIKSLTSHLISISSLGAPLKP